MASINCTFPSNENPLTNGGNGANTFENTVSATWTNPIVATGGTPGHILGPGSSGTNDAIAKAVGTKFAKDQTVQGTVYSVGTVGAAEIELHTRMTMTPVAPADDLVFTYEYDFQPTIMALAYWAGLQGSFVILFNPTITELIDGDVIKGTVVGVQSDSTLEAFINGVSQGTGHDTDNLIPVTGQPGVGLDNDTGVYGWKAYSATDGISDANVYRRMPQLKVIG